MAVRRLVALVPMALMTAGCMGTPKAKPSAETAAVKPAAAEVAAAKDIKPVAATAPAAPATPGVADTPVDLKTKLEAFVLNANLAGPATKSSQLNSLSVAWSNKIVLAPDPTKGGEPTPGLLARIHLFAKEEGHPLPPDGELIAGAWDMAAKADGGQPQLIELWHIDRESARKFIKKDLIGEGYSIYLPFTKYHVDLKQVTVRVRYNGADGRNFVSAPETLTLDHTAALNKVAEKLGISRSDSQPTTKTETLKLPGAISGP